VRIVAERYGISTNRRRGQFTLYAPGRLLAATPDAWVVAAPAHICPGGMVGGPYTAEVAGGVDAATGAPEPLPDLRAALSCTTPEAARAAIAAVCAARAAPRRPYYGAKVIWSKEACYRLRRSTQAHAQMAVQMAATGALRASAPP
jgi:hypothetical protein